MSTDITVVPYFNGTALTLKNVSIDSYSYSPVMAHDGITVESTSVSISGTCIVTGSANTWATLRADLQRGSQRLSSATMVTGGSNLIDLDSDTSNIGGPFLKLTATEVVGAAGLALVRFELYDTFPSCTDQPLLSHNWTQTMSMDQAGHATRTINGYLRAYRGKDGTMSVVPANATGWTGTTGYADFFRRPIIPDVPGYGWRRESQQFAYDQQSTGLIYQVVDKQHAYDLPDGVRVGDMEFSYERNIDNPGVANLTFSCDLEGDLSLTAITSGSVNGTSAAYTGNRYLLQSAIQLSKTRIDANFKGILITRLRVTEKNLLSGYAIRLEIDAQAYPTTASGVPSTTVLGPIAYMVGQRFTITRTLSRTMDPYGPYVKPLLDPGEGEPPAAGAYYMVPHYIDNMLADFDCAEEGDPLPKAQLTLFTGSNLYGNIDIAVADDPDGITEINAMFGGKYNDGQTQPPNESDYTQIVSHNTSITHADYDSGLVRMSAMYLDKPDLVLQTRKPVVRVREHVEITASNTAPAKLLRPLPAGAHLVDEEWNVSFGKYDAQGQRSFTGMYDRTFAMYDAGGASANGFSNQSSAFAGTVRAWAAPSGKISPTLTPTATNTAQANTVSVFGSMPSAAESYPVTGSTFVS